MSNNSSFIGQPCFKINQCSPLWRHVEMIEQIPGDGTYVWICRGCDQRYKSSYNQVKAHLCAIPNMAIKTCPGKNGVHVPTQKIAEYIREQEEADAAVVLGIRHPLRKGKGSQRPSTSLSSSVIPDVVVESHPFLDRNEEEASNMKRTKRPLERAFQNNAREIADQTVARCLYANGLPFNVVQSPYWQDMLRKVNEAPKGYTGPSYEKVCNTLLSKEVKNIKTSLAPIRGLWKQTGVSIVSSGWTNVKNKPFINVTATCPNRPMFLKVVDCQGQMKDAEFIANILIQCIQEVGPQNVVQIITDNTKICKAAGMLVEAQFPHIFWTPCAIHSLNLMLQKLARKIDWIKQVFVEAKEIQMFVTNHEMLLAIYRSFSQLKLLKVVETQFAPDVIILKRLVKVREALSSMVTNQLWSVWRQSNSERAKKVKHMILDDIWWDRVEYLLSFTEPIMNMICFADMNKTYLGEVYCGIELMIEKMKSIINEKEQDPQETFFKKVHTICVEWWNKMTTPLHHLAFALTPKYYSNEILSLPMRVPPYSDVKVSEGCKQALTKLFPDPNMKDVITSELADFVASTNQNDYTLRDKYKMDARNWWYLNGYTLPQLQILAIKIFSQVVSSSSSEKNWSTYPFIHSMMCNQLASSKAEKLVYMHSNLPLLTNKVNEYKERATKLWDVDPEQADLDVSTATPSSLFEESYSQHAFAASGSGTAYSSSYLPTSSYVNDDDDVGLAEDPHHDDY